MKNDRRLQNKSYNSISLVLLMGVACAMYFTGISCGSEPQWAPPVRPKPAETVISNAEKEVIEFIKLLNNPRSLTKEAVKTFTLARALYREGYFAECRNMLAQFWEKNPRNAADWGQQQESVGYKLGYPCVYPALVLLSNAVEWRMKSKNLLKPVVATDWNVVVLLVGRGSGFMPGNDEEAKAGKGKPMTTTIDSELLADGNALLYDVVWLTREYYLAMTEGKISLRLSVVHLADVSFDLCARTGSINRANDFAKLPPAIPKNIARQADWYWLIYPEIDPPEGAEHRYYLASFGRPGGAAGGITGMPGSGQPLLMSEDHWLTRRVHSDGHGPVHPVARQIFIPYWIQHEAFHNHFGGNSHLNLEVTPHQWFDRKTWPEDFVGRFEPDYYEEAMKKRLQQLAQPSLAGYFIHRANTLSRDITQKDVIGRYAVATSANNWGTGEIKLIKGKLSWVNAAGKSWGLKLKPGGILETDKNNPYFDQKPNFELISARTPDGLPSQEIGGFRFGGQEFLRK